MSPNHNFYMLFSEQLRADPSAPCIETDDGQFLDPGCLDRHSAG
jgi:hypothetical protein